jgi:uncharacterized protein
MTAKRNAIWSSMGFPFTMRPGFFLDAGMIDLDASRPGDGEVRRKAVGLIEERIYAVVYAQRLDVTRIISARRCNAKEARRNDKVQTRPR